MAWKVELAPRAQKDLKRLEPQVAKRILAFLRERVAESDDPRSIGQALKGSKLGELWKYRVGDYRLIVSIEDKTVKVLVLHIGSRREVYR
jgi:mRNA interferase RelE/StbE